MDNTSTKRTSSSYSPVAKRQQKQRKREQDKTAALKYRNRKKQELLALDKQQTKLEQENAELFKQVKSAEEEIVMLKSLLREIYAPCNHGNPTTNTMSQSNNLSTNIISNVTSTIVTQPSVNVTSLSSGKDGVTIQHPIHDQSRDGSQDTPSSTSGSVNTCGSSCSNVTDTPQGKANNTAQYNNNVFHYLE